MADVQFENQGIYSQYTSTADRRTTFVRLLMDWGWAKDEKRANYILIGTILLSFILSLIIIFVTFESKPKLSQAELETIKAMNYGNPTIKR